MICLFSRLLSSSLEHSVTANGVLILFQIKSTFLFFFVGLLFTMSAIANGVKEFVKKAIADNKVTVRLPLCRE